MRAIANGALVLTAMVWVLGCSNKSSSGGDCETGSERCACYGNKTCDKGLECLSDICVSTDGAGGASGGAGGDGGKNAGGNEDSEKGGAAGDANEGGHASVSKGGKSSATGGKSSVTAGTTTTGGATTVGGSAAVGGTTATSSTGTSTVSSSNLIKNGDFGLGKEYWDLTYNDGDIGSSSYSSGKYCVSNPSSLAYLSFSLGYPPTPSDAFVIEPGVTYKLSYYLSGSGLSSVTAKIGHAVSPYTSVFQVTDAASSLGGVMSHTFSTAAGDTAAGLVFNGTLDYGAQVCFDDVIVQKN